MNRAQKEQAPKFSDMLRQAFHLATVSAYSDRVALYVVDLADARGFRVAQRLHKIGQGPDPAVTLAEAQQQGARNPLITGSAAVEALARLAEGLPRNEFEDTARLGSTLREMHATGEVPVLSVMEGDALVHTLAQWLEQEDKEAEENENYGAVRLITPGKQCLS